MDKDTIPYHDTTIRNTGHRNTDHQRGGGPAQPSEIQFSAVAFLLIVLLRISAQRPDTPDSIESTSQPGDKPASPMQKRASSVWSSIAWLAVVLLLLGCAPGDLSRPSTGWSPVAAAPIPQSTGSLINEGSTFSPEDNLLSVTDPNPFVVGHVIEIGGELMEVTSISFRDLGVARGMSGTTPRAHPDGSEIMLLAGDMAIYIGTKQGAVKSLRDDGSGIPSVEWISSPLDPEQ